MMLANLYSDTQTRPVEAMRAAMAAAEVGDEQLGEDPTVNALCERVAELLGKPAAVFLPSGTMCNAIGFRLHIRGPVRQRSLPCVIAPEPRTRRRGTGR
jgi:threonine aldolase